MNRLRDGREIRLADPAASTVEWELEYRGLSDAERASLTSFFGQMRGRLTGFLFLDPCGNLLAHSDDLTRQPWSVTGMVQVQPQDSCTRLINTAQTVQPVSQSVEAPGWFCYCGSGLFRASECSAIRLFLRTAAGTIWSEHKVSNEWHEAFCSGSIEGETEEVIFGMELPAGLAIDVRALQLEAQPGRSGYRRTTAFGSLYPDTRFAQDELLFRADGLDNYSTSIRLVSPVRL